MAGSKRRRSSGKTETTVFLTVAEVKDRLASFVIFDARYNLAVPTHLQDAYAKGHLPGAIPAYMDTELSAPHAGTTARHPLPPAEAFIAWCQSHGVTGDKPVLTYDDQCGAMGGCRLWWMLHSLGVEAYVLDGGYQAYAAAGLTVAQGPAPAPAPVAAASTTAHAANWPLGRAFAHHVTLSELSPNAVLTDARAAIRFNSTARPVAADTVPGHIPGAYSLPYTTNMKVIEDGTGRMELLAPDAIRSGILRAIARDPGEAADLSDCVFSCGSGISACANIAAAYHVGLGQPLLYCGSWSEYSGIERPAIQRATVATYGVLLSMQGAPHMDAAKASVTEHVVTATPPVSAAELELAASYLHLGETATAYFRSGHTATITVRPHS